MKKLSVVVFMLIMSGALCSISYALWRHNTEVRFKLTISQPVHDTDCFNCTYSTIQEGIDLHKNVQYPKYYNRMDNFKSQLQARITELNNLPFGGITYQELSDECNRYRNVDIAGFGTIIDNFGTCIDKLATFYKNSTKTEKSKVPDFWAQHNNLWDLSDQLWNKRQELYDTVNALWAAGESKIDYNNNGNGNGDGHGH